MSEGTRRRRRTPQEERPSSTFPSPPLAHLARVPSPLRTSSRSTRTKKSMREDGGVDSPAPKRSGKRPSGRVSSSPLLRGPRETLRPPRRTPAHPLVFLSPISQAGSVDSEDDAADYEATASRKSSRSGRSSRKGREGSTDEDSVAGAPSGRSRVSPMKHSRKSKRDRDGSDEDEYGGEEDEGEDEDENAILKRHRETCESKSRSHARSHLFNSYADLSFALGVQQSAPRSLRMFSSASTRRRSPGRATSARPTSVGTRTRTTS